MTLHAQIEVAGHLDGAAEGDLAVALREVDVAHREAAALHVDGEVDLRAAREVLDVAVAAVLARRHGARALHAPRPWRRRPSSGPCARSRRTAARRAAARARGSVSKSAFSRLFQVASSSLRRQAPDEARVHDPRELDARDVPRVRVDAAEIPARLARLGIVLRQEAAAVLLGEDAGEPPLRRRQHADVEDVDDEEIARLRALRRRSGRSGSAPSSGRRPATSLALSSSLICPPVQSMHSTRNSSPGLTHDTIGMSGCQRL